MIKLRRGVLLFSGALVAATVAIFAAAALASWWVPVALIPLAMVVGCLAMMTAVRRTPAPSAGRCGFLPRGEPLPCREPRVGIAGARRHR